ncbi:MAG: ammonium transporter [Thermodesulfobacteriota bacterium]
MDNGRLFGIGLTGTCLAGIPSVASAADFLPQDYGNILWTLIAAILVMFMQAGFAMVEAGFTRAKNAGNILMKNALDFSVGSVTFFLFGFALMFGADVSGVIGSSGFGLSGIVPGTFEGDWALTFLLFQSVFAATAATIVSGGIAERTKFSGYILVSLLVTGLVYPVSGHWAWGSLWLGEAGAGWLENLGFADFAGSTVVHSVGGWIALAGAWVLGPRRGKYTPDRMARAIPGHNIPLGALGVFILWFAWFGFNAGSTTTADGSIGYIALNTNLSAAAGVIGAMLLSWIRFGKPDVSISLNGALAGLVGITAGCFEVSPMGSIIIGFFSGVLCVLSVEFIDKVLRVDDPVGAVSVHGVCGAFGTLCVGLFAAPGFGSMSGLFYGGGIKPLLVQALGIAVIMLWALFAGFVVFKVVDKVFGIRVSEEEELKGLDISEHGMEAYSGFQVFSNE